MIVAALLAAGFVLWTAVEYGLHRFVGHTWNTPLKARHLKHHDDPLNDGLDPKWSAVCALLIVTSSMIATWLLSLMGGVVLGYVCYELCHWWVHHNDWRHWRHLSHHANQTGNYGVTTRVWDWALRTTL